ncbi:outer membrane beta-barrel protein [Roseivirga sp. E12]|uniref:outer membrane beta-barrel protein n=1 Tax=Roseivirga sp. E12 TaxID=2819237 RepID=UPI001ABD1269|nr:outer membrane beta-barrel protein [Roseivirga sp. E12]MBO3697870.1 PorT family protein [Roseivirga sp. E12]
MKLRLVVFIGILSVMNLFLSAQSSWREGYVIELNGDTTNVLLKNTPNKSRFLNVQVKKEESSIRYLPQQLKGYGFYKGKSYSSELIDSLFIETLVLGEVELYRHRGDFFVRNQSKNTLKLSEGTIEYAGEGGFKRKNKQWKGALFEFLSDCGVVLEEVQSASLNESELTHLIIKYNKCKGSYFKEVKSGIPKLAINYGVSAGIRKSTLKVFNENYLAGILNNNYESSDLFFGLSASFLFPRLSEKSHFETELRYTASRYTNFVTNSPPGSIADQYETIHDIDFIQIPLSLRYYIIRDKVSFFVQPGIAFSFVTNFSSNILYDNITQSFITTENRDYLDIIKRFFTAWVRTGVTFQVQNFEIGLIGELFSPITNFVVAPDGFISSLKQSSIGIIISLK